ncbi:SGNH hydrolase-type esterase domain-containing protein [Lipomyces japonicus]|uniref:SGNH hydrolase-type esterase domain-containing protein n=1 Tax=Lipomyces japonicus TaxID=56871 RepID=UPI0034CEEA56
MPTLVPDYKKVILFGDSQTELSWNQGLDFSFSAGLQHYYMRRADVLNRGLCGYNTIWLKSQFDRVVHELERVGKDNALLFVLWLGTNDCPLENTLHHVPVDQFIKNVSQYIKIIQERFPLAKILLITPAPISETKLRSSSSRTQGRDRSQCETKKYVDALLSHDFGYGDVVRKVDLFTAIAEAAGYSSFSNVFDEHNPLTADRELRIGEFTLDGLHLNGKGYKVLYNHITTVLNQWPGVSMADLPGVEPGWLDKSKKFTK